MTFKLVSGNWEIEYDDLHYVDDAVPSIDGADQSSVSMTRRRQGKFREKVGIACGGSFSQIEKETPTMHPNGLCCR
jgi:hypothetical protein